LKNLLHQVGELGREQQPLAVPGLPPRVREVDVDGRDRARGYVVPENDFRITAAGLDVRQVTVRDPGGRVELVPPLDLDAEVVPVRVRRRGGKEEHPLAEADFDLDAVGVAEEGGPGNGLIPLSPWGRGER